MGNPKYKISRTRRDKRRTHKILTNPILSLCPECKEPKMPHRVCPHCGTYKGRQVVAVQEI